jgi:SAM-dependent methyltransferase
VEKLKLGYSLVTGNRRLGESEFEAPVSLIPLAYGRHRLGLLFNRAVRLLFGFETIDTQAGIKAMTRELAARAFLNQRCPGFFFDIELFLTARNLDFAAIELPVVLHLNSEKSTVRLIREACLAFFWLSRIALEERLGAYGQRPRRPRVLPRYRTRAGTAWFLRLRWWLTPYSRITSRLAPAGRILDLGCGHGLLALTAALERPDRELLGLDHDEKRIELAQRAAGTARNLRFETRPMLPLPDSRYRGILMIDVLHYFPAETQAELIRQAFDSLEPGGTLLVREVDPHQGFISKLNRTYERLATGVGFTRSKMGTTHQFRSVSDWETLLATPGFQVRSERCSAPIFSDVLFVAEKPWQGEAAV